MSKQLPFLFGRLCKDTSKIDTHWISFPFVSLHCLHHVFKSPLQVSDCILFGSHLRITGMNSKQKKNCFRIQHKSLKDDMNGSALKQYLRTVATPRHPPLWRNQRGGPIGPAPKSAPGSWNLSVFFSQKAFLKILARCHPYLGKNSILTNIFEMG